MSRESHFNSILNNSRAAEIFFEACAVAFGSLSWEAANVELIMYRMNYPWVCMVHHCRDMDMGSAAWKVFQEKNRKDCSSSHPVSLCERNKLLQGIDKVEPNMTYLSLNKTWNKLQLLFPSIRSSFFKGGV